MKFVDEASITVRAGNGGNGIVSFRRERFIARGGPDGGNGGDGGSVYVVARAQLNTLVDFRHKRHFEAMHGGHGMGKLCTGRKGKDLLVPVPTGTLVCDQDTGEAVGDMTHDGQKLLVARGGIGGRGNTCFRSSTNRTPRQSTQGEQGDSRRLTMELKLLADVGLVGLPNAGKSTLMSAISAASPKIGDYPFTTLHPSLGVVNTDRWRSFVVADLPGLIEGAARGEGLGIRFLRHVQRTRLLLQLVDVTVADPVRAVRTIEKELAVFNDELACRTRWLVCTKIDLLSADELASCRRELVNDCNWRAPVFFISAQARRGLEPLKQAITEFLEDDKTYG